MGPVRPEHLENRLWKLKYSIIFFPPRRNTAADSQFCSKIIRLCIPCCFDLLRCMEKWPRACKTSNPFFAWRGTRTKTCPMTLYVQFLKNRRKSHTAHTFKPQTPFKSQKFVLYAHIDQFIRKLLVSVYSMIRKWQFWRKFPLMSAKTSGCRYLYRVIKRDQAIFQK